MNSKKHHKNRRNKKQTKSVPVPTLKKIYVLSELRSFGPAFFPHSLSLKCIQRCFFCHFIRIRKLEHFILCWDFYFSLAQRHPIQVGQFALLLGYYPSTPYSLFRVHSFRLLLLFLPLPN